MKLRLLLPPLVIYCLFASSLALGGDTVTIGNRLQDWNKTLQIPEKCPVNGGAMSPCLTVILLNEKREGYVHHFFYQGLHDFESFIADINQLEVSNHRRAFNPKKFQVFIAGRAHVSSIVDLKEPRELIDFFKKAGFPEENILVRYLPEGGGGELIVNNEGTVELIVRSSGQQARMPIMEWPYDKDCFRVRLEGLERAF